MININNLQNYIKLVVHQAHESENKPADRFFLQAWLLNYTDLAVVVSSPYLRVTRKVYYRLNQNIPKNFHLRMVNMTSVVYQADTPKQEPLSCIHLFDDVVIVGLGVGELKCEALKKSFYVHISTAGTHETYQYLEKFVHPDIRIDDDIAAKNNSLANDEKLTKAGFQLYAYPSDSDDPVATSKDWYEKATGFRPPELAIEPVITLLPENGKKPISI